MSLRARKSLPRLRVSVGLALSSLAASVLVTGIGQAGPAVAATGMAPVPADATVAPDIQSAVAIAKAHKHSVHISQSDSERASAVANADGTVTTAVTTTRSRWKGSDGKWQNVNLDLTAQGDGSWAPKSDDPARRLRLPGVATSPVTFSTAAGSFSLAHVGAVTGAATTLTASATTGAGRQFAKALQGRDLTEQATVDGIEETVTLDNATEAGSYTDLITVPAGVVAKPATGGGVDFLDGAGSLVANFSDGLAHDSTPTPTGDGEEIDAHSTLVSQAGTLVTVAVGVDDAWLHDPARVFPVAIDPGFYQDTSANGSGAIDTWVESHNNDTPVSVGIDPVQLRVGYGFGNGQQWARSLIDFNFSSIVGFGAGDHVSSAELDLVGTATNSCNLRWVGVAGVYGLWDRNSTWDTPMSFDTSPRTWAPVAPAYPLEESAAFAAGGSGPCQTSWEAIPITQLANRWFTGSELNQGLVIKQPQEDVDTGWEKFASGEWGQVWAPEIKITWTPNAQPTLTSTYCANCGSTDAPTFYAQAADADGDPISYTISVYGPSAKLEAIVTATGAAGTWIGYQMPPNILRTGTLYSWTVAYTDGWPPGGVAAAVTTSFTLGGAPSQPATNVSTTTADSAGDSSVFWTLPTDDGGASVQVWRIAATVYGNASAAATLDTTGNANGATMTGLVPGIRYVVTVTGWSSNGWSAPASSGSNGSTGIKLTVIDPPGGLNAGSADAASPAATGPQKVPTGYQLHMRAEPDSLRYYSRTEYLKLDLCVVEDYLFDECTQAVLLAVSVQESVAGGDSKNWGLTQNGTVLSDEFPAITWNYTWTYSCGINTSGDDHVCVNGASPSGSIEPMTPGLIVTKRFEETVNSGIDYPMVNITANFNVGKSLGYSFREWDVCNSTSSVLCQKSGDGMNGTVSR